jgi:MFS family permease
MLGFGAAGMVLGRWSDRAGIRIPVLAASALLGVGYILSGYATTLFQFALAQGLLIGVGSSVTFGPLLAHVSMWFERRRGIAVAIVASGNYFAGPCGRRSSSTSSRRRDGGTYFGIGVFVLATMLPLALLCARAAGARAAAAGTAAARRHADRSACRRRRCRDCWSSPASRAASRCRCPRSTSSRTARTWATGPRAARRCCR